MRHTAPGRGCCQALSEDVTKLLRMMIGRWKTHATFRHRFPLRHFPHHVRTYTIYLQYKYTEVHVIVCKLACDCHKKLNMVKCLIFAPALCSVMINNTWIGPPGNREHRSPALSVCYSPDAFLIAVGLSGGGVSVLKPSEEDTSTLVVEKVTTRPATPRNTYKNNVIDDFM